MAMWLHSLSSRLQILVLLIQRTGNLCIDALVCSLITPREEQLEQHVNKRGASMLHGIRPYKQVRYGDTCQRVTCP